MLPVTHGKKTLNISPDSTNVVSVVLVVVVDVAIAKILVPRVSAILLRAGPVVTSGKSIIALAQIN